MLGRHLLLEIYNNWYEIKSLNLLLVTSPGGFGMVMAVQM